jgi:predicted esterase
MKTTRNIILAVLLVAGLAAGLLILVPGSAQQMQQAFMPMPTSAPDKATMQDFAVNDFDAVHAPINNDANEYLIFGNLPITPPSAEVSPELAAFLGRWEGYSYASPVQKDWKFVLVIQEITAQGGKAFLWMGTNLQYPSDIKEISFRVVPSTEPSIEWTTGSTNAQEIYRFNYDADGKTLEGWRKTAADEDAWGPIELTHQQSFYVYKDYSQYLASKRIYPKTYRNDTLTSLYGDGYLVYLPKDYDASSTQKTWPLLLFLHGSGDRGDNVLLLAKASPFMMIREQGPLPFIIVAPLLKRSYSFASFPDNYLNGVLDEVLADYRVDQSRIYLTGLSMGGEATYRFAVIRPEVFAAIAPLSAFTFGPMPMQDIRGLPVWAIHGANDMIVPLAMAQKPVEALRRVGNDVKFSVLANHDHDVWTDTYSDPGFYDWLLQHEKP